MTKIGISEPRLYMFIVNVCSAWETCCGSLWTFFFLQAIIEELTPQRKSATAKLSILSFTISCCLRSCFDIYNFELHFHLFEILKMLYCVDLWMDRLMDWQMDCDFLSSLIFLISDHTNTQHVVLSCTQKLYTLFT